MTRFKLLFQILKFILIFECLYFKLNPNQNFLTSYLIKSKISIEIQIFKPAIIVIDRFLTRFEIYSPGNFAAIWFTGTAKTGVFLAKHYTRAHLFKPTIL